MLVLEPLVKRSVFQRNRTTRLPAKTALSPVIIAVFVSRLADLHLPGTDKRLKHAAARPADISSSRICLRGEGQQRERDEYLCRRLLDQLSQRMTADDKHVDGLRCLHLDHHGVFQLPGALLIRWRCNQVFILVQTELNK